MAQVTLNLPPKIEQEARAEAARTKRRIEDVLQEWLERYTDELPIDLLADENVLELSDMQMTEHQQTELSDLLALNRENQLAPNDRKRLDELLQIYSQGMVRKAEALKEAVHRGLISPLT